MSGRDILIVDDDVDFAEGMHDIMDLLGHRADIAHTGNSAVEFATSKAYDAIIMDIGLPDMSGIECLREIRKLDSEAYCFLVTGYSASTLTDQGAEIDAAEILTKPVNPDFLFERIAALPRRETKK